MTSIGRTVPQAIPTPSVDGVVAPNRSSRIRDEHLPHQHRHDGAHSKEETAHSKLPSSKLRDEAAGTKGPASPPRDVAAGATPLASALSDREILDAVRAANGERGTIVDKFV